MFGGSLPEPGDEPTDAPDVALVVLAEPLPQELLLRCCFNDYPQKRNRPEQQQADIERGYATPE